jgi:L-ascorbate metabolism protein UlaG (beta-lactamase superfamily)
VKLTYLGHSSVKLEASGIEVLIDPFISGNPVCTAKLEGLHPAYILLTHAHADHLGDTEHLARQSGAMIISNFEIVSYFAAKGLSGHAMNIGGSHTLPFANVKFTPAWHSNSFPDGRYGGMPMGIVLELEGKRLYHAGDTAVFGDMALIGKAGLDLALLPIGDNFTMGPDDAIEAAKLLKPKQVMPIHYNTFELIRQDTGLFKAKLEQQTSSKCVTLSPGDVLTL